MLNIFLTNLGKYNEGELIGEWVSLPCPDFDEVFERIGVSDEPDRYGRYYEEWFITDYETDCEGMTVDEYADLDELNEMAEALEGVDGDIVGALMANDSSLSVQEAVDAARDVIRYSGCYDMEDVARRYYEETGMMDQIDKVISVDYVDWEAVGRDMEINGTFLNVNDGYIEVLR